MTVMLALGAGAMSAHEAVLAQHAPVTAHPPVEGMQMPSGADLEQAFWVCDHVAATRGVSATPMAACAAVTDELKSAKFGGSFEDMLAWWQVNKAAAHERLER